MTELIIKRGKRDFRDFIFRGFLAGIVPYILSFFILFKYGLIGLLPICILIRHYIYKNVELYFRIKIVDDGNALFLKFLFLNFRIDKENSFLIIENIAVFVGVRPQTEYGLILVRNGRNKIFKNRVKLYSEQPNLVLEEKMKSIGDQFGIRYVPFFEDPNKWWW